MDPGDDEVLLVRRRDPEGRNTTQVFLDENNTTPTAAGAGAAIITTTQTRSRQGSLGPVAGGGTTNSTPTNRAAATCTPTAAGAGADGNNQNNNQHVSNDAGLPDLADVIFAPEKVNAHTVMNKWLTEDETRNFIFLRKEKKAVVTFQCRIVVKGAKHIPLQVACGPSVDFLMPTWNLVRYIQAELLPPCVLEDYRLVETWMQKFIPEVKKLTMSAVSAEAKGTQGQQPEKKTMTRHVAHAAASVVNATDLFLGLISSAKDNPTGGGGVTSGGGGGGYQHHDHGYFVDSDDENGPPETPTPSPQQANTAGFGFGAALRSLLPGGSSQQQQQQRGTSPQAADDHNNNSSENNNNQQVMMTPMQLQMQSQVMLASLIPPSLRVIPHPVTAKSLAIWVANVCYAVATQTKWQQLRSKFLLPRPTTKEEWQAQEMMRDQVKRNRTHAAMVVAFIFLLIMRYVSFDLFIILAIGVEYGVRYVFTEYKNIFIYFTKRTAKSRVNRVKDWFTFGVRRKDAITSSNNNAATAAAVVGGAGGSAADQAAAAEAGSPDFDLEEWDFFGE